jgi:uncharacterized protein involved in cysteine biosynthesis
MIRALALAIGDLADPRLLGVLLRSLLVTLLIFVGLGVILTWALDGADPCAWWGDGGCELGLAASSLGAVLLAAMGLWLLFPAVAIGVISTYMDRIIALVEARHYPAAAARARPIGWGAGAALGLRSTLRLLAYNIVALPLYLILLVTGVGTIVAFVIVNGLAFGRDLGEMVAARHGDGSARKEWLRSSRSARAAIGMIVTAIFMVPFVNLLAPILGATMIAHHYHRPQAARGDLHRKDGAA